MLNAARQLHNNGMSSTNNERTRVSRWQDINPAPALSDIKNNNNHNNNNNKSNNLNPNVFPPAPLRSTAALPSLLNVTPTQSAGLLPSPNLQSLLGEVPSLLKNRGHQLFAVPPNIPPLRLFDVHEQKQPLPNGFVGFFANHQQQTFLPNHLLVQQQSIEIVNAFLGNHQKNPTASLNNTILSQLTNKHSENVPSLTANLAPSAEQQQPLPVPPLPSETSSMDTFMVPPPPPPPVRACQNSQCLADSPMDIEDDQDEVETSEKERNAKECEKKGRNKKVQMADELMKRALRPYFRRRRITKDEYKEIMIKGVAKLKKRHSLKAEKVEKFVYKYVLLVAAKRKNQFGY